MGTASPHAPPAGTSRRTFVKGLAVGGAAASLGLSAPRLGRNRRPASAPAVLSGTDFDLRIGETAVNITGRARTALTINGSLPGPLLRWREGDTVHAARGQRASTRTRRSTGTASSCRPTWTACRA